MSDRKRHGRKRRTQIGGQFAPRLIEMINSPAYRTLSLSARRTLDRIEIELAAHGGNDNGKLPVTYSDFEAYGIDRKAIAPALREVVELGFVEITERGRPSKADWRFPNKYRLTYRHHGYAEPTHDWRKITSFEAAERIAKRARLDKSETAVERSKLAIKRRSLSKNLKSRGQESPHEDRVESTPTALGGENTPTVLGANVRYYLDSRVLQEDSKDKPAHCEPACSCYFNRVQALTSKSPVVVFHGK